MDNQTNLSQNTFQEYETKWNWGAFSNWMFFALGNGTYLAFLNLVPVFNIFWIFWTAAHAEQWALETNIYANPQEFRTVMDTWNRGGLILFIVNIVVFILMLLYWTTILSVLMTPTLY